jgi:hypothetical protein
MARRLLILTLLTAAALAATVGLGRASAGQGWSCNYRKAGVAIFMGPSFGGPTRQTAFQHQVCMHFRNTGWHRIPDPNSDYGVSWCGFHGHGMAAFETAKDATRGTGICRWFIKPYFKPLGFKRY